MDFDKFESDMLAKIDAGEQLTERELSILTLDFEVKTIEHGTSRWHTHVETICELCDRTFSVKWDRGLTERQENEFYNQPVEVRKNTFEDGEWSMFTRITSAYYGKEYYFLEPNGTVYSRHSGKVLENKEEAYNEFFADMEQC